MRWLWAVITQKPVEIFSGLVMISVGIFLTSSSDNIQRTIGTFLATFGGVLISWNTSIIYTKDQAKEDLKTQLEALRRQLGTVCSQISQALSEVQAGSMDADTSLTLVSQSVQSLYGVVNEIQVMTGGRFEASAVLETVANLEDFADKLASIAEKRGAEKDKGELTELSQQLGTYVQNLIQTDRTTASVTVPCPECSRSVSFTIGIVGGDSAISVCPACGIRFHAHRRADGSVLTRKWGFYSLVKSTPVTCPYCERKHYIRTGQGQTGLMIRYCVECGDRTHSTRLEVDIGKGELIKSSQITPAEGRIVRDEAGHSILECPSCKQESHAFVKKEHTCYAVCGRCDDTLFKAEQIVSMVQTTPGVAEEKASAI